MGAAHRDRDVFHARFDGRRYPTCRAHPATRQKSRPRYAARADGGGGRPRGRHDFPARSSSSAICTPGRARADHQHRALGQLAGVACRRWNGSASMPASSGTMVGHDGALERSGGGNDTLAASITPCEVSTRKPGRPVVPPHFLYLHAATDGRLRSFPRRRRNSPRRFSLGAKASGSVSENSMPGKRSCQAGPLATRESHRLRAPAFGNPVPLQHEMRHAAVAQVLAHGEARLAAADDEGVDLLNGHPRLRCPKPPAGGGLSRYASPGTP